MKEEDGATTGNDVGAKPTGYSETYHTAKPLAQAINCGDADRAAKLIQDARGIEDRGLLSRFVTEHRRFAPPRLRRNTDSRFCNALHS